jgi:hypothetical protein
MKRALTNYLYRDPPQILPNGDSAYDANIREDDEDWPAVAHTMVGMRRLVNVQHCLERVLADDVHGDFIEAGVWRGGVCIFARAVFRAYGVEDRSVWVADSFKGVPALTPESHPLDRRLNLHAKNHALGVPKETVRENFRRYGLLDSRVIFVDGWFAEALPRAPIRRLAVIRLDADLYCSTRDALEYLYPKLSAGGFVIVDDYGIPACEAAVHEFRHRHAVAEPLQRIDPYSVYWQRDPQATG